MLETVYKFNYLKYLLTKQKVIGNNSKKNNTLLPVIRQNIIVANATNLIKDCSVILLNLFSIFLPKFYRDNNHTRYCNLRNPYILHSY